MKNVRKQIKHGDENSFKIQNKYKINHKIPQLERKNHTQKELNKEQNSLINFKTNKEPLISQKKINKKLFLIPKFNLNTEKNRTIIEFNTVDNDLNLNLDNITKHKKLLFPITNNNNDEIIYKEKNNSVENNHNKIYVHKKLKNANKKIMNISRNDKSNQNIKFRNTFFQTNKNKDYYQNLIFFPNKPKIFKKKQLSDIENMDSEEVENKIPNIKYLNRSPIAKKKRIFFEVPLNENLTNTNDESGLVLLSCYKPILNEDGQYYRDCTKPIGGDMWIPNVLGITFEDGVVPVKVVESQDETGLWMCCFDDYFGNELHLFNYKPTMNKETKKIDWDEFWDDNHDERWELHIWTESNMVAGDGPIPVTLERTEEFKKEKKQEVKPTKKKGLLWRLFHLRKM